MKIFFAFFILFLTTNVNAELLKPSPEYLPKDVISIQLSALKVNDSPYSNAGIEQTWEFAHPMNKKFTGPLSNFINMMNSPSYIIMLDHKKHNIILVNIENNIAYFFVELIDKNGSKFGFQWALEKVLEENELKNCWMTISVSSPFQLSNSA
tara:strand:- start:456 stop:911 length:456 start_codon:yes stop_codon:yes gene_type:complete